MSAADPFVVENNSIYLHYIRHEFSEALTLIESVLEKTSGAAEYPLYVKGSP
jgi:hypothetical protein